MARKIGIIGIQTGDEGKGKVAEKLEREAVARAILQGVVANHAQPVGTMRFQGGGNAGHTITLNGQAYKLHQIPSGILVPGTYNLCGERTFVDPQAAMVEIKKLRDLGILVTPDRLGIASNAHVTLAYHVADSQESFQREKHTSTGRGIKETATDKFNRVGLRLEDFLDEQTFREAVQRKFPQGLPEHYGSIESFSASYDEARTFLRPFSVLQSDAMLQHGTHYWFGEGAQGHRIDVDRGLYPGVTSSNPTVLPFAKPDEILGVVKFYESSVGSDRPFVGKIQDEALEAALRDEWGERGTTTGKDRDLGWFDAVAVRYAIESCEIGHLVGTCGDRLEALAARGENVKLVVAYNIDGKRFDRWDPSFHNRRTLYTARPIFEEFEPWDKFIDANGEVALNAQRYVDRIQKLTGKEFAYLGTGPESKDFLTLHDVL